MEEWRLHGTRMTMEQVPHGGKKGLLEGTEKNKQELHWCNSQTLPPKKPPVTHGKGCLLLPNLPLQRSSSAETKETLNPALSSPAPPFTSWCLFTALLHSLPHFYSSSSPAKATRSSGRSQQNHHGARMVEEQVLKMSCNFRGSNRTHVAHKGWIHIASLCPTSQSPGMNLHPATQITFSLPKQAFPETQAAETTHGKWLHLKILRIKTILIIKFVVAALQYMFSCL